MTLPGPPEGHGPDYEPEPAAELPKRAFRAFALTSLVLLLLLAAIAGVIYYLTEPDVKPTAAERRVEAPIDNANPCGHDTFDANACSVRLVMGAAQQANTSPSAVISIFCARWATPRAQRREIDGWIEQGATRAEGRAVMNHILAYCPEGS